MFKLKPNPTFWAKVEILVPGADAESIEIEFRHMGRDALERWIEGFEARPQLDCVREVVVNWRGVDVEFSDDALERLARDFVAAPMRIVRAYLEELRGDLYEKSKLKSCA